MNSNKPDKGHCSYPGSICLLNVKNRNMRKRSEICSKLTIKTPEWRPSHDSDVFIVKTLHILHLFLEFLLLTLNRYLFVW